MASLSSLYRLLSRYQSLLEETRQMVNTLTRAIDDLEPATTKIEIYFSIDDVSADLKEIASCSERIESNRDFLKEIEELEAEEKEKEISES